jgi:phosphoglycerate dehydrogenase-like enzyme
VLLSESTWTRFGARLEAEGLDSRRFAGLDAVVDAAGNHIDDTDVDVEIAWATADAMREPWFAGFLELALASPSLQWFHSPAAGGDVPMHAAVLQRGVRLTTSHVNAIPIAEFVLRGVLDWFQRSGEWRAAQQAAQWRHHEFREVAGTTLLVVGLGAIGTAVAERARAFGVRVIGVRRTPASADARGCESVDQLVGPDRLLDVLPEADIVVLCAPLTAETAGMVDATFLSAMGEGSLLVNVARGGLVDETALLGALDRGRPQCAILDVFATEPLPPGHPFWTHPAVVVSPHSSAGGDGRFARAADVFFDNLARLRSGEQLLHEMTVKP